MNKIILDKIQKLENELDELKALLKKETIEEQLIDCNTLYNGFFSKKVKKTQNRADKILRPNLYKIYVLWCNDNNYPIDRKTNFLKNVHQIFGNKIKTKGLEYIQYIKEI